MPESQQTTQQASPKKKKLDLKRADSKSISSMNSNMNSINDRAETIFSDERKEWAEKLNPLYKRLANKNMTDLVVIQSDCLSIREQIQQSITYYATQLSKANVEFKNANGDRLEYYMTGFGVKTASSEKVKMVDRDLSEAKRRVELLEAHIDFLRECRYSCDQVQYAVKNVVGLITYLEK